MTRAARLLDLLQALRRHRRPVSAATLAAETGVSLRTVYRDIATLVAEGAPIEGEAGLGYVMRPGFTLPPLMFTEDEVDAVILGLRLAATRGDPDLADAADHALAKIVAVLPPTLEEAAATNGLLARGRRDDDGTPHLPLMRHAIRTEERVARAAGETKGAPSRRVVWPVAIGFFHGADVLAAWCETRADFRHFRLDRIEAATPTGQRFPKRHRVLLAEWRLQQDLDDLF